jgi:methyl-accepting chemotaxis protein
MSLKKRFLAVIALAVFGLLSFAAFWLTTERDRMLAQKREKIQSLVESVSSLLERCYSLEQHGMSRPEAQKQAIALVSAMRYEGDNYFWINDLRPTMVMHPTKPQLDGTDLSTLKDPTGKALFIEMADVVRRDGAGFVAYQWPRPGAAQPVSKISYVKGFAPWGWVIGTGIYVDDVDAAWSRSAIQAGMILLVTLALMSALAFSAYRRMFTPLDHMVERMQEVAHGDGDLTHRLDIPPDREVAELARAFNSFMDKLQSIMVVVCTNLSSLAAAGEEISVTSRQQMEGAAQQRDQTHQVATATQQMTAAVQQVNEIAGRTAESAQKAANAARQGGQIMEDALSRMHAIAASTRESVQQIEHLGQQSEEIGRIIAVIDDIADQTNLLALNAAIEAAHAGDRGRGFAVVADEVRKLAERTARATNEITQMIHGVQQGTRQAVAAMHSGSQEVALGETAAAEARASLQEIIDISDTVGEMVAHIATAATEQLSATQEVSQSAERIAEIAVTTANSATEATKAMDDLARLAGDIEKQVGQFRVGASTPFPGDYSPEQHESAHAASAGS